MLIQVSPEKLDCMIADAVTRAFKEAAPPAKKYLTRQEVAELFGVTLATIHTWINKGIIQSEKIGGRTLFEAKLVEDAIRTRYSTRYSKGKEVKSVRKK